MPAPGATPALPALRSGCSVPPIGETRFVSNEIILDIPANVPTGTLDGIASRHTMTRVETTTLALTGRTLHRWRIDSGGSPEAMIRNVCGSEPARVVAGPTVPSVVSERESA